MYKRISDLIKNIFQNHFELAVAISAVLIILMALAMDKFLYLQACPLCVLTRYVFGLIGVSALIGIFIKKRIVGGFLIIMSSMVGLFVTSRQIYIQNMSVEEIAQLSGCGMPFHTQVEYFGLTEAINRTLAGGPSCAEDGWRFIFNFAEWGFLFFAIYLIASIYKYIKIDNIH